MPRKPRLYIPDIPCHIIQRGNNRYACFFFKADYRFYLECLTDACNKYQVAIHAYVLMTNHVHLLMTPASIEGISRVMQSLGRRYVQYINRTYQRCGTLWESRHKSCLVDAERYLLACYCYIELNPVTAGMVAHPGEYHWCSYHTNAYGEPSDLLRNMHSTWKWVKHQSPGRPATGNCFQRRFIKMTCMPYEQQHVSPCHWAMIDSGSKSKM